MLHIFSRSKTALAAAMLLAVLQSGCRVTPADERIEVADDDDVVVAEDRRGRRIVVTDEDVEIVEDEQVQLIPGEPAPLDPETVTQVPIHRARTTVPEAEAEALVEAEVDQNAPVTIYGEIESMGPFAAEQAGDGKWMRLTTAMGIVRMVHIPPELWVRAGPLNLNKGDDIQVTGVLVGEGGTPYLQAVAIEVD